MDNDMEDNMDNIYFLFSSEENKLISALLRAIRQEKDISSFILEMFQHPRLHDALLQNMPFEKLKSGFDSIHHPQPGISVDKNSACIDLIFNYDDHPYFKFPWIRFQFINKGKRNEIFLISGPDIYRYTFEDDCPSGNWYHSFVLPQESLDRAVNIPNIASLSMPNMSVTSRYLEVPDLEYRLVARPPSVLCDVLSAQPEEHAVNDIQPFYTSPCISKPPASHQYFYIIDRDGTTKKIDVSSRCPHAPRAKIYDLTSIIKERAADDKPCPEK